MNTTGHSYQKIVRFAIAQYYERETTSQSQEYASARDNTSNESEIEDCSNFSTNHSHVMVYQSTPTTTFYEYNWDRDSREKTDDSEYLEDPEENTTSEETSSTEIAIAPSQEVEQVTKFDNDLDQEFVQTKVTRIVEELHYPKT